jgi:hypothetical protein
MGDSRSYGATDSAAGREENVPVSPIATNQVQNPEEQNQQPGASQKFKQFYDRNFGLFLVFLAQTCGSIVRDIFKFSWV